MHTNYETHNPGDDLDPKDVAPAMQSVPHVPFVLHTTHKGIINNATMMETQKDIGVVKLSFHSVSSFSILITCRKCGTPWYYVLSSIDKTIANDVTNCHKFQKKLWFHSKWFTYMLNHQSNTRWHVI